MIKSLLQSYLMQYCPLDEKGHIFYKMPKMVHPNLLRTFPSQKEGSFGSLLVCRPNFSCIVDAQVEPRLLAVEPKRAVSVEVGEIYRTASALSLFLDDMETRPQLNRLISMPSLNNPQDLLKAKHFNNSFEVLSPPHQGNYPKRYLSEVAQ